MSQDQLIDCDQVAGYLDATNAVEFTFLGIQEGLGVLLLLANLIRICRFGTVRGVQGKQKWTANFIIICSNLALCLFIINNVLEVCLYLQNSDHLTYIQESMLSSIYMLSAWLVSLLINDTCLFISLLWLIIINRILENQSVNLEKRVVFCVIIYNVLQIGIFVAQNFVTSSNFFSEFFATIEFILACFLTFTSMIILILCSWKFFKKITFIQPLQHQARFTLRIIALIAGALVRGLYYIYMLLVSKMAADLDIGQMYYDAESNRCQRKYTWAFSIFTTSLIIIIILLQVFVANSFFNHKERHSEKRHTIQSLDQSLISVPQSPI